jgi:hypothetical protein
LAAARNLLLLLLLHLRRLPGCACYFLDLQQQQVPRYLLAPTPLPLLLLLHLLLHQAAYLAAHWLPAALLLALQLCPDLQLTLGRPE